MLANANTTLYHIIVPNGNTYSIILICLLLNMKRTNNHNQKLNIAQNTKAQNKTNQTQLNLLKTNSK